MARRPHSVQTPGEETAPEADAPETNSAEAVAEALAPQEATTVMQPLPAPVLTGDALKQAQLDARIEATKDLIGSEQALDWSHLTQPNVLAAKVNPNLDDGLPDSSTVNPATIPYGRSVLTKQGWVTSTQEAPSVRR